MLAADGESDPHLVSSPFTWVGLPAEPTPGRAVELQRPAPQKGSQFAGERAFLGKWYRALWPSPPAVVKEMTPSEIASVLGLDEVPLITAVPLTDEMIASGAPLLAPPPRVDRSQPPAQQRLRRIVVE